ncbi:penicillin-binding protein 2 [Intrasporangium sp.]|uniref:peptidoglycan D,D-transpeptidase FtsI family protein n=1 Tax=Intrasporangium sp. TaxID=1925024 RepID=UPI003221B1E0
MLGLTLVILLVFGGQLFRVQGLDASATQQAAMSKRSVKTVTPAMRGQILDTNGRVLAESVERFTVVADPVAIAEYQVKVGDVWQKVGAVGAASDVAPLLGMDAGDLQTRFTRPGTRYVIVKKDVTPAVWSEVKSLGVPGIAAERTAARVYPLGMALGPVVGVVRPSDQSPLSGIEYQLDKTLSGTPGTSIYERARDGYLIPGSERVDTPVVNGRTVRLTIDADLQWLTENALAKRVRDVGAKKGSAVVIEVATGKVRALANYPSFDPNDLSHADPANMRNGALNDAFEPGSTGKLITFAAALQEGVITPDTGVIVPNRLPRAGMRFKDNENHPTEYLTATGVIAKSSNIGTMLIGERIDPKVLVGYFHRFGLGSKSPIDFPGESAGDVPAAKQWVGASRYTRLFGQAYSATALQMTGAYQAIANKGLRMPPTLVDGVMNDSGTLVPAPPQQGVRVVPERTATTLSRMIEEVTGPDGTARDARIKGYRVAGKTGTADFYDQRTGGYHGFTASFIGYAPAEAPKYVVGVFLHQPSAGMFGGALAGPVFNQVMSYLIERDGAAPSPKSALDYHVWVGHKLSPSDPDVLSEARAKRDGL